MDVRPGCLSFVADSHGWYSIYDTENVIRSHVSRFWTTIEVLESKAERWSMLLLWLLSASVRHDVVEDCKVRVSQGFIMRRSPFWNVKLLGPCERKECIDISTRERMAMACSI